MANDDYQAVLEAVYKKLCDQRGAFSWQQKREAVDEMEKKAREGVIPITEGRFAKINIDDPRFQAIINGEEVALTGTGTTVGGDAGTLEERLRKLPGPQKALALLGMVLVIALLAVGLFALRNHTQARKAAAQTAAAVVVTETATATLTPTAGQLPDSSYSLLDNPNDSSQKPNDPISIEFGGLAFVLSKSRVQAGAWQPAVAEWLDGTELRRVVAVPFSQEVGNAVAGMAYGDPVRLRLGSGEVVEYRVTEIKRLQRHQIEVFASLTPSLVVILHSERAGERYVLIAEAVQGCAGAGVCYTPTPTLPPGVPSPTPTPTPTPTATPTPLLAFTPPVQVTLVVTDSWSVVNEAAGLRLDIVSCSRVAQIGTLRGKFVVCNLTLTALRDGVTYSGQTLAIAEYSQVANSLNWWPEAISVVGGIGDGTLARTGETISGQVAGEVIKGSVTNRSDPVLIWEQAGTRYVIYLEH